MKLPIGELYCIPHVMPCVRVHIMIDWYKKGLGYVKQTNGADNIMEAYYEHFKILI